MSGFSAAWLALREPVDHRSRDAGLLVALAAWLSPLSCPSILDLGCGTGSNLRATAPHLGPRQRWTLVDHDAALLDAARQALIDWADHAVATDAGLELRKHGRLLEIRFRRHDLVEDLGHLLGGQPDLVTASALFDLCSPAFIDAMATAIAVRRIGFYTVLTYDGVQHWSPPHPDDDTMLQAFLAHQRRDKGFGAAAGPDAPAAISEAFRRHDYAVTEADTPWRLGQADPGLIRDLADGFATAVSETGQLRAETVAEWRRQHRDAAVVGHRDTLALPPAG